MGLLGKLLMAGRSARTLKGHPPFAITVYAIYFPYRDMGIPVSPYFSIRQAKFLNAAGAWQRDSRLDQAGTHGVFGQFNHVVHLEFSHQITAVNVDRTWRNTQFDSNFRRALALGKQGRNLQFAP